MVFSFFSVVLQHPSLRGKCMVLHCVRARAAVAEVYDNLDTVKDTDGRDFLSAGLSWLEIGFEISIRSEWTSEQDRSGRISNR